MPMFFDKQMSLFPPLQQYGLIYRQRMAKSGFDAKEITTIVNVEMALSSLVGLVNGAMFRRFSFRQVAILGSLLAFTGIFLSAFCETFMQYVLCFSFIYGKNSEFVSHIGITICFISLRSRHWTGSVYGSKFFGREYILQ